MGVFAFVLVDTEKPLTIDDFFKNIRWNNYGVDIFSASPIIKKKSRNLEISKDILNEMKGPTYEAYLAIMRWLEEYNHRGEFVISLDLRTCYLNAEILCCAYPRPKDIADK